MKGLQLYESAFYPSKINDRGSYKYEAIVGIGANKGNAVKTFRNLWRFWLNDRRLKVVETSPILQNPPFGFLDQPDFFNAIIKVKTSLNPQRLLSLLLHTEKRFKRTREFKNAPRTLDLDIILYDNIKLKSKHLTIPHPHYMERISVLLPLAYME